ADRPGAGPRTGGGGGRRRHRRGHARLTPGGRRRGHAARGRRRRGHRSAAGAAGRGPRHGGGPPRGARSRQCRHADPHRGCRRRRSGAAHPHQRRSVLPEGRARRDRQPLPPPGADRGGDRGRARRARGRRPHRRCDQRPCELRALRRRAPAAHRLDLRQRGARPGPRHPGRRAAAGADPAGRAGGVAERAHRRDGLPLRDPPPPTGRGMITTSRRAGALFIPLLLLLTVAAALVGMAATGALAPASLVPASPLVTWGLPVVRALHHLGLVLAIGAGGTAVLLLPGPGRREVTPLDPLRRRTVRLGAAGALLWTVAALAQIPLGGLEATGAGAGLNVWDIAMGGALGRLQMGVVVFAAATTLAYALARSTVLACWGLAFAGIGTGALGLAGHAGASLDHINAVNAMALHLVAVSVWAGGLLLIALLAPRMEDATLAVTIRRFSPWALASVVSLALSGLISAWIRLSDWTDLLTTGYGRVVLAKTIGLTVLAVFGALQRRRLGDRVRFRHLAATEGLLMAVVIGASIALGRSAPPVPQEIPAVGDLRVLSLAGFLPPKREFSPLTMFTEFQPDWIALALAVAMAGAYILGAVRLARRGDAWQWHRTAAFLAGCLAFAWVMNGGAAAWGKFRFDAHMIQHMAMMMIVPPLWALGAPVTLLSRAVTPRTDGSRGIREWVLAALHSGYSR